VKFALPRAVPDIGVSKESRARSFPCQVRSSSGPIPWRDVLASTANLLKVNGWHAGAPFGPGTGNFDVMREWNHAEIYRRALVLFAERLMETQRAPARS